jgi:hypothetical protein
VHDVDPVVGEHRVERLVRFGEVVGDGLLGRAGRAGADDAGDLDAETPQRLDMDDADEAGPRDRGFDVPE